MPIRHCHVGTAFDERSQACTPICPPSFQYDPLTDTCQHANCPPGLEFQPGQVATHGETSYYVPGRCVAAGSNPGGDVQCPYLQQATCECSTNNQNVIAVFLVGLGVGIAGILGWQKYG